MEKMMKMYSFRLSNRLRQEKDPKHALHLFLNQISKKPFTNSLLSYDLIIKKLGRAKLFDDLQLILFELKFQTYFTPTEIIFCNVITFYARARLPEKALQLFDEIPSFRCPRTIKSFNTLLNGLLLCKEFVKMEKIFVGIDLFACPDACSYNIMINACRMRGDMEGAWKMFDEMRKRNIRPDKVTFSTLIAGLCSCLKVKEALKLKEDMTVVYNVKPNVYVYGSLIKGLCENKKLSLAFQLKHEMLENNIELDSTIYTTLICGLFKAGRIEEATYISEEMKRIGCSPNTATYNALISGCCVEKRIDLALLYLKEMEEKACKPDVVSYNVLINAYFTEGKIKEATDLFEDMPRRGCKPDIVSYRTVVKGLLSGMKLKEVAFVLDEMMFKGFAPHLPTVNEFLTILHKEGNLELLLEVISSLAKGNYIDANTWTWTVSIISAKHKQLKFHGVFDALIKLDIS